MRRKTLFLTVVLLLLISSISFASQNGSGIYYHDNKWINMNQNHSLNLDSGEGIKFGVVAHGGLNYKFDFYRDNSSIYETTKDSNILLVSFSKSGEYTLKITEYNTNGNATYNYTVNFTVNITSDDVLINSSTNYLEIARELIYTGVSNKTTGTVSINVDVDRLSDIIFNEMMAERNIEELSEDEINKFAIDRLTKKVGLTGLTTFANRANAIMDYDWGVIYDYLGYPQKTNKGIGFGERLYYDLVYFENGTTITLDFKTNYVDEAMEKFTNPPIKGYKIYVYKEGKYSPIYKSNEKSGEGWQSRTFNITEGGLYYVLIKKANYYDWSLKLDCQAELSQ